MLVYPRRENTYFRSVTIEKVCSEDHEIREAASEIKAGPNLKRTTFEGSERGRHWSNIGLSIL